MSANTAAPSLLAAPSGGYPLNLTPNCRHSSYMNAFRLRIYNVLISSFPALSRVIGRARIKALFSSFMQGSDDSVFVSGNMIAILQQYFKCVLSGAECELALLESSVGMISANRLICSRHTIKRLRVFVSQYNVVEYWRCFQYQQALPLLSHSEEKLWFIHKTTDQFLLWPLSIISFFCRTLSCGCSLLRLTTQSLWLCHY